MHAQSGEPAAVFPSIASLFLLEAVAASADPQTGRRGLAGWALRARSLPKWPHVTAQPDGSAAASRTRRSEWETLRVVDVAASAAAAKVSGLPQAVDASAPDAALVALFPSLAPPPAASSPHSKPAEPAEHAQRRLALRLAVARAVAGLEAGASAAPRAPSSLQAACIAVLANDDSATAKKKNGAPSPPVCALSEAEQAEQLGAVFLPDGVASRVRAVWAERAAPLPSRGGGGGAFGGCKSRLLPPGLDPRSVPREAAAACLCASCGSDAPLLKLEPGVNPEHHRFLEAQFRLATGGDTSAGGFFWTLVGTATTAAISLGIAASLTRGMAAQRRGQHEARAEAAAAPEVLPPAAEAGAAAAVAPPAQQAPVAAA